MVLENQETDMEKSREKRFAKPVETLIYITYWYINVWHRIAILNSRKTEVKYVKMTGACGSLNC